MDFARRMERKAYFGMESESQRNENTADSLVKFKGKSNWAPTKVDPALELFLKNLHTQSTHCYSLLHLQA